jgi:hypothetical protein
LLSRIAREILRNLSLHTGLDVIGQKDAHFAKTASRRNDDQIFESILAEGPVQHFRERHREAVLLELVIIMLWFDGVPQTVPR